MLRRPVEQENIAPAARWLSRALVNANFSAQRRNAAKTFAAAGLVEPVPIPDGVESFKLGRWRDWLGQRLAEACAVDPQARKDDLAETVAAKMEAAVEAYAGAMEATGGAMAVRRCRDLLGRWRGRAPDDDVEAVMAARM